eukprot:1141307-Pelagomonas_calceolata.AAC.6
MPYRAKNVAAYGGHFGPVHDYVVKKLASGEGKHLALFGNRPAQSGKETAPPFMLCALCFCVISWRNCEAIF